MDMNANLKKDSKYILVIATISLFILILGLVFVLKDSKIKLFSERKTPLALPINPDHPNVVNATTFYTITGRIEDIKGNRLRIKSKGEALPELEVSENTKISKEGVPGEDDSAATSSDLKKGEKIILTISYDYTLEKWRISNLKIISNSQPVQ